MKALLLALAALLAGPTLAMTGVVTRVSDGDTVWVRPDDATKRKPVKVRLVGIDAPERCQPWGAEATAALRERVLHQRVEVPTRGVDTHGRLLGGLRLADGSDVAAWMVSQGHAWSSRYRRHPGPYAREQQEARQRGAGLFAQAGPMEPWVFRRIHGPCD